MIVIINGAPGAGKTFLLNSLHKRKDTEYIPIRKYTTRLPREFEKNTSTVDLEYNCSKDTILQMDYWYEHDGNWYGIDKTELEKAVSDGFIPVIIVRSFDTIRKIKNDFSEVRVLLVIGATGETLEKRLKIQPGRMLSTIRKSQEKILLDYVAHKEVVDYCIVNYLYDEQLYLEQFFAFTRQ